MPGRTRARARALPGGEVEGDLAGGGDEQHGQGQAGQPDEQPVQAHGARACVGRGAHPVGEVDDHERQEQQPQGAGAVAGGEVAPHVRLGYRFGALSCGAVLGVGVGRAPEDRRRVVPGDPHGARVVEHPLGRGAADSVDQELQGGLRRLGRYGGLCPGRRALLRTFHCSLLPRDAPSGGVRADLRHQDPGRGLAGTAPGTRCPRSG
ncbi:hypothetical protein GCM10010510_14680 [Streptomyces anandii JCM 4720]|nr:hypothetical protein GCM10010510_14680 [Streptomyces anandii JCM 4720]